ncbi:hypothetical protein V8E52_003849 [Russula decolorans]
MYLHKYGTLCSTVVLVSPLAFYLSWPQLPTSSLLRLNLRTIYALVCAFIYRVELLSLQPKRQRRTRYFRKSLRNTFALQSPCKKSCKSDVSHTFIDRTAVKKCRAFTAN